MSDCQDCYVQGQECSVKTGKSEKEPLEDETAMEAANTDAQAAKIQEANFDNALDQANLRVATHMFEKQEVDFTQGKLLWRLRTL